MKKFLFVFLLLIPAFANAQTASVTLTWTATGDDSTSGTAAVYDLRWSTDSTALVNDFFNQNKVSLVPPPIPSGGVESFTVTGLPTDTIIFFSIIVADEVPNWCAMSNIVRWRSPDMTPPARITNLRAL